MLFADRKQLWPRLSKLGEKKVREMRAADRFEAHEDEEVKEWLARQTALGQTEPQDSVQAANDLKDIKLERGCRRLIRENWSIIKQLFGKDADAHQVLRVLKQHMEKDGHLPQLKTVQNKLSELRKEKLLP